MPRIRFLATPEAAELAARRPADPVEVEVEKGTSILEAAQKVSAQVGYACGGNCACSTCHVYVTEGFDSLSEQREEEEDILDKAFDVKATSRLSCQAKVGDADLVCLITRESRQAYLDEHPNERAPRGEAAGPKAAKEKDGAGAANQ
jgi:2Fe-2S ferredoxin